MYSRMRIKRRENESVRQGVVPGLFFSDNKTSLRGYLLLLTQPARFFLCIAIHNYCISYYWYTTYSVVNS